MDLSTGEDSVGNYSHYKKAFININCKPKLRNILIMQKKLLSLAIASALALPGAAMADIKNVEVYGKFHASWDYVDNDATGDDTDDNTGAFRNSRLGFKGEEKISGDLKGIWQIETELDTGDNEMQFRNTFVGLKGDKWGTFLFGKHDTPYKMATANLDIFSDTIADYNNIIGAHIAPAKEAYTTEMVKGKDSYAKVKNGNVNGTPGSGANDGTVTSSFNKRAPQTVAYLTPDFSGFQAAIARVSFQNDEKKAAEDNKEAWSAMAKFDKKDNPFFASLAYELYKGGIQSPPGDVTENLDAWKIGLGYKIGNSKIGFIYEDIEQDGISPIAKAASRDAFGLNFSHDFGMNTVKVSYLKANDSDAAGSDDGADNWSIGLDHNFSKRTKIYGIYTRMENDSNANYGLYNGQASAGGSFYTGGAKGSDNTAGRDISAISFGIVHSF
uniref:Outer membrane protein (Porin) n=1 Tax=Candidatus Kentrum sp. LPFa TaxID=2126335 RepID=A0A450X321_9GAMM|nr:MAG: Outer membrane protein (porin) [Candidatus Kentron sp. LPFa]